MAIDRRLGPRALLAFVLIGLPADVRGQVCDPAAFCPGPGPSCTIAGTSAVPDLCVLDFGTRFDPQPFHTDPEAAARSPFGGLVASGWHTCAITTRLLVDGLYSRTATLGSAGVDEIRWRRPVRPGDRLSARFTVLEARPSQSRPERGIVRCRVETLDQRDEVVMTLSGTNFVAVRPAG